VIRLVIDFLTGSSTARKAPGSCWKTRDARIATLLLP
jgi:hypothetical protein